jgi:hypothetical protein
MCDKDWVFFLVLALGLKGADNQKDWAFFRVLALGL